MEVVKCADDDQGEILTRGAIFSSDRGVSRDLTASGVKKAFEVVLQVFGAVNVALVKPMEMVRKKVKLKLGHGWTIILPNGYSTPTKASFKCPGIR